VTYGTFAPGPDGGQLGSPEEAEHDLAAMSANGINTVRTYTVPPGWFLDACARHALRVLIGLPWEQHVAFLDDRRRTRSIERRVREGVASCAGHPAVLGYAVGNEIPASIVRWHGRRRVERFIKRLYRAAKAAHPEGLVTYVNFPTTEYLRLPFLDFVCFNVYLESDERLEAYLARLQNVAGDRPLVLAEIGLDSRRNGLEEQADTLARQIRTAFAAGCAGAVAFAWTDRWHRGGHEVEDWDFGLTDRDRRPKPARDAVRRAFAEAPFPSDERWPQVSVVVCTHDGAATLNKCLSGLARVHYPHFEVVVVDDGSTDDSHQVAAAYGVRLIRTENRGLSAARNTGAEAACGEIVAYLDDDAWPDPHWLHYIAKAFMTTDHAGVGGPNIPPEEPGAVAQCVANAPGGPIHVLLSDTVAEHIPGCNMAYRRDALLAVGGFDPQFRVAGDDVDLCWKLQEAGETLGYHAGAMVWHHRRGTLRRFWRQQRGYGKAEALLERKWPQKYNGAGHLTWAGRVYNRGASGGPHRWRVYYGVWGTGAFQPGFETARASLPAVAHSPEWFLVVGALGGASGLGLLWPPLLAAGPLLILSLLAVVWRAAAGAVNSELAPEEPARRRWSLRLLTGLLYVVQPAARLTGRIGAGLAPWRRSGPGGFALPRRREESAWHESWRAPEERLRSLERSLRAVGTKVRRAGPFDHWDLEVATGAVGSVRVCTAVEEHGSGRQLTRCLTYPRVSRLVALTVAGLGGLVVAAALDGAPIVSAVLMGLALTLVVAGVREGGEATAAVADAVDRVDDGASAEAFDSPFGETAPPPPQREVIPLPVAITPRVAGRAVTVHQRSNAGSALSTAGEDE